MSDFEDIQRLLRLKRYERPPEDFVEDFVRQFHHRQRQEIMRHSARGLLWERVSTYFEGLFAPKWRWAGAMAAVLVGAFVVFKPGPATNAGSDDFAVHKFDYNDKLAPVSDAEVERYLISKHFEGGFGNEPGVAGPNGGPPLIAPTVQQQQNTLLPTNSFIRSDLEVK